MEVVNKTDQNEPTNDKDVIHITINPDVNVHPIINKPLKDFNSIIETQSLVVLDNDLKIPLPTPLTRLKSKTSDEIVIFQNNFCPYNYKKAPSFDTLVGKKDKNKKKPYFYKTNSSSNKFCGSRVISDTVLTKRNFSSDNEQIFKEKSNVSNKSRNKQHLVERKRNISVDYFGKKPIIRNALATISHIKWLDPNTVSNDKSKQNQHVSSLKINVKPENKENVPSIPSEKQVADPIATCSAEYENVLLFSPQYYWNTIFSHQKKDSNTLLEDFHMLLYDYERLWNHVQQQTVKEDN